jgi:drug/metabolite transporter (DMT)-like permease
LARETSTTPTKLPEQRRRDNLRGAIWGLGMVAGLGGVSIAIRALKSDIALQELLFFRAFIGLIAISLIMIPRNGWRILIPRRPGLQIVRNMLHVSAQYCVFFAVLIVPLAEVTAIEFTVPLITCLFAAPMLKEKIGRTRWIGMIVGFVGILFVVRPVFQDVPPAILIAIFGAVLFSLNTILVKVLSQVEEAGTMVFVMNVIQTLLLIAPTYLVWTTPQWHHLPWLLMLGLSGILAHYCLSRALAIADTSVVLPLDFLRLPFIALIAYWVWGETFSPWTAVGAVIIFGSSYFAIMKVRRER